ncbi:MAG: hypothetical protein KH020_07155 [Clostridiales bacterium]|nr:hypothetical protein [Clostridiales bacterium]
MNKTFYNASGCKDPTAGRAIVEVVKEEKKVDRQAKEAVHLCEELLDIADFELIGRIKIRDKKTGREYR